MTTNFTDTSTDIVYLGNISSRLASVQNFNAGGVATRTQLLLTKTTITSAGTNYTVTAISNNAFITNIKLQSVDFSGMGQLTSIGNSAFYRNTALTELNNFTNVTKLRSIGNNAFGGATRPTPFVSDRFMILKSVDFGGMGELTSIGNSAFYLNRVLTELKNFTNATQLKSIGDGAFKNNSSLQSVDFGGMGELRAIDNEAFRLNTALTELKNFTKATKLEIIGKGAFFGNSKLQSVDFGGMGELTTIGLSAFYNNIVLTELKNFTNVTKLLVIRDNVFYQNYALQSVDFGGMGQLERIELNVFYNNTSLTELKNFTNATKLNSIENQAFYNNYALQSVDFGGMGQLRNIYDYAFYNNTSLTELKNFTKATKLLVIGGSAFESNSALQSVDFGGMGQLITIYENAFLSNTSLTELNFGNLSQNLYIYDSAFNSCISLRQVYYQNTAFLEKLTSISGGEKHMYIQRNTTNNTILSIDFQKAVNLTSINTGEFNGQSQLSKLNNFTNATNLLSIDDGAFAGNSVLKSVDFGGMGQLTNIGGSAFYYNTALTELKNFTSATQLETIGAGAFEENYVLQSVDFGGMGQLTSLSNGAFYLNTALTELKNFTNATKLQSISDNVFAFNYALQSVDFGGMGQLTSIGGRAFYLNTSLTELKNFTNAIQLKAISFDAFAGNFSLKSVDFGGMGELTSIGNNAFISNIALTELKNFTNATKLKTISSRAFQQNFALQSLDFGGMGELTSIGVSAFYLNTALIALNNFNYATSLKSINAGAFQQCSSIQTIFFPIGLTNIRANAFNSNISLRNTAFNDPTPTSIAADAFINCTSLKSIYHYGTDTSQLTQLTALANGALYNLSEDIVDYADYDTHIASAFNNYGITNEVQISDIKNIYAANLIQIALNGTIFDPFVSDIQVKVGAIPFLTNQLNASLTDTLILYPNYTTPDNRYIIGSNTDPVYFQMNLGSVLYLSNNNETITKNADNTYTYSGTPTQVYQPGATLTIGGRLCVFGGFGIGSENNSELGNHVISGISPKPIIIVERGNERGANRQILRRAGFFNMNTYTQENPGNNVNYILDSGIPVKNKTYLNKDSSDRTRKLKLKAQNKTYNDPSFGGNDSNGAYSALAKVRH
jgi:CO dehydrogenase/acetyl-CoA synthase epsilon subunit